MSETRFSEIFKSHLSVIRPSTQGQSLGLLSEVDTNLEKYLVLKLFMEMFFGFQQIKLQIQQALSAAKLTALTEHATR